MDWMKQLGGVLDRYADAGSVRPPDAAVHEDFDRFAQAAPPDALADGLSAAFRSDQTPPFPQMASQLFGRASGAQRANILNMLLTTVGPLVVQLADHDTARHSDGFALIPKSTGCGVDALVGRDDEQGAVGGPESGPQFADEIGVPGGVDQVHLDTVVRQ